MQQRWYGAAALAIVAAGITLSGCKTRSQLYCDQERACLAGLPACDLNGVCPASEFITNTCIRAEDICWDAAPGGDDAMPPDAGGAGDAGASDAALLDGDAPDGGSSCMCSGTAPICDNMTCRACQDHSECASEVCNSDGSCEEPSSITYADANTGADGPSCGTQTSPCLTIGGADGALAKVTTVGTIKLRGTFGINNLTIDSGSTVRFVGPAEIQDLGSHMFSIRNGSQVEFDSVTLDSKDGQFGFKVIQCDTAASVIVTNSSIISSGSALTADSCTAVVKSSTLVVDTGWWGSPIVASNANLTVEDSTMSTASLAIWPGIDCSATALTVVRSTIRNTSVGIKATASSVTLRRSLVSAINEGGLHLTSSFYNVVNNVIVGNGGASSDFGGVKIDNSTGAITTQILAFNTIADNQASASASAAGVECINPQAHEVHSNVVWNNTGGAPTVSGTCTWTYSDIEGGQTGTGNIDMDPKFVNAPAGDYHLTSSSPCRDAGDPNATLGIDVDGDARPEGGRHDMGADEFTP